MTAFILLFLLLSAELAVGAVMFFLDNKAGRP